MVTAVKDAWADEPGDADALHRSETRDSIIIIGIGGGGLIFNEMK